MQVNIFGSYDTRDLLPMPILGNEVLVLQAIARWAALYGAVLDTVLQSLVERTDTLVYNRVGGSAGGEMQPYIEYGETEATRQGGEWNVGFPIFRWRDRQVYTEEFVETDNLFTLNKDILAATQRNYQTVLKMVFRAVLYKANYIFQDAEFPGKKAGPVPVKRLLNADGQSGDFFNVNGITLPIGSQQSYITSGSNTVIKSAFAQSRAKLKSYGRFGDIVHIISTSDEDTVRAMSGFLPTGQYINSDRLNFPIGATNAPVTSIVDSPRAIGRLFGDLADGEVISMPFWPAGYHLSMDRNDTKPVVIRAYSAQTGTPQSDARFRGLRLVQNDTGAAYGEKSIKNKRWEYIAGAGVENRVNGVAVQHTTSGTYTNPTI